MKEYLERVGFRFYGSGGKASLEIGNVGYNYYVQYKNSKFYLYYFEGDELCDLTEIEIPLETQEDVDREMEKVIRSIKFWDKENSALNYC